MQGIGVHAQDMYAHPCMALLALYLCSFVLLCAPTWPDVVTWALPCGLACLCRVVWVFSRH